MAVIRERGNNMAVFTGPTERPKSGCQTELCKKRKGKQGVLPKTK